MKPFLAVAALAIMALPSTVFAQAQSISASDKATGAKAHPELVKQFGGAMRGPAAAYVERVGRRIAVQSGLSNSERDFTVTLLDSPVNNAFAIPGGYVYVTRGLLALMNDEAELASVLGHEVGHVAARHAQKRQQTATITQVLAGLAGAVAGNSGLGSLVGRGAATGADLITKGFSRGQESQADDLGVTYLARAGYDPDASSDMLAILAAQEQLEAQTTGRDRSVPTWASTHPNSADRVVRARQKAEETGAAGRGERDRDTLLNAIDGLPFGDDPDKGFADGKEFRLPAERLAFTVPQGYALANGDDAVVISGQGGQATFADAKIGMGGLDDVIAQAFGQMTSGGVRYGRIETGKGSGLDYRYAFGQASSNAGLLDVGIFAWRPVAASGEAFTFVTLAPAGRGIGPFQPLVDSLRRMSAAEAAAAKPLRIKVLTVKPGETPETFAKLMATAKLPLESFLVLNGLKRGTVLRAGDRVKVVVRG